MSFYKALYKTFEDSWSGEAKKIKILFFPNNIDVAYSLYFKITLSNAVIISGIANIICAQNKLSYDICDVNGTGTSRILIGSGSGFIGIESLGENITNVILKYEMFDGYVSGVITSDTAMVLNNKKIVYDNMLNSVNTVYTEGDLYYIDFESTIT